MNGDNVDTINPEHLLEDDLDAGYILTGDRTPSPEVVMAARNLARLLVEAEPVSLARTIAYFAFQGGATPTAANAMVDLLEKKIADATPDELNTLVREAKIYDVWIFIKPAIMKRNNEVAQKIYEYRNMNALEIFLDGLATDESNWLPGPVYAELETHLRQLAEEADITLLDAIADVAKNRNLGRKITPALRARNEQLISSIAKYRQASGFILKQGGRSLLEESPIRALRLIAQGYEFVGG